MAIELTVESLGFYEKCSVFNFAATNDRLIVHAKNKSGDVIYIELDMTNKAKEYFDLYTKLENNPEIWKVGNAGGG